MYVARVGIVGCGTMGAGIAEISARAGVDVRVVVSRPTSADRARARITGSLGRLVAKGRLTETDRDATLGRISFVTELDALADRQLVIESITEDEPAKLALFKELDRALPQPDAVIASNTSSIPIHRLAEVTSRPERVAGIHFFNPVQVLPLVELVASETTGEHARRTVHRFAAEQLGKQVVWSPDRVGFTVNGLLIPFLLSAVRMVESGLTTAEAVDQAMKLGCNHPLGPLELADLIGLDVVASTADALHREFREPLYAPPELLLRLVAEGAIGRKAGRGFHTYPR
ncbi:3-hydroxybutyryl-CoA dehydrogenase [Micromonospora sp. NPDC049171]|uniref:3-hydroxybutyryl-CoA dehydrogenase n=1 Tax=Micromonospora sp. NPDC049171 TaxID=3155770 RepID=UPI0033D1C758